MYVIHLGLDISIELAESVGGEHSSSDQFVGKGDDRIARARLVSIFFGTVVLDVAVVVPPQTGHTTLDQHRSSALPGTFCGFFDGVAHDEWVGPIDGHSRNAIAACSLRDALHFEGEGSGSQFRPAIVFADDENGQAASGSEGKPFMGRALVECPITDGDDHHFSVL